MKSLSVDAPAIEIIREVREFFTDPFNWLKNSSRHGNKMCLAYAVLYATNTQTASADDSERVLRKVANALGFESSSHMMNFNDEDLTTHAVLLARLDKVLNATTNA